MSNTTKLLGISPISIVAAVSCVGKFGFFTKFSGDGVTIAGAGGRVDGVITTEGEVGDPIAVQTLGAPLVKAGGTIAKYAAVKSSADGKAVAVAGTDVVDGVACGIALEAAVDGDLFPVMLRPNHVV